jgi:hypothetical protein
MRNLKNEKWKQVAFLCSDGRRFQASSLRRAVAAPKIDYVQKTKIPVLFSSFLRVSPNNIIHFSHLLKLELSIVMLMLIKLEYV